jgi:hypothetical protein
MHFNIYQYGVTYIILIIEDLMIEENGIGLLKKKRKEIVIITLERNKGGAKYVILYKYDDNGDVDVH